MSNSNDSYSEKRTTDASMIIVYFSFLLAVFLFLGTNGGLSQGDNNAIDVNDAMPVHRHLKDVVSNMTTQVTFAEIFRVLLFVAIAHYAGEIGGLIKMPSLVGQIFAGVLLGPQVLDFVPFEHSIVLLGEIGLILLMFEAGIEMDFALIKTSGANTILMSTMCTALATGCGIGVGMAIGVDFQGAFSIGATFAQTAIGTCLPVMQNGDLMGAPIGQMILVATMIDDMFALTLLSVMTSFGGDEKLPIIHYFLPIISSISWVLLLGYFALAIAPRVINGFILPKIKRKQRRYFVMYLLMTGVTLAYMPLLTYTKSSYLMGASLAGMTFSQCKMASDAFLECQTIYDWLMKLFFAASIGFQIPVQLFGVGRVWAIGSIFIVTAVPVKAVAALFVPKFQEKDAMFNLHHRDQLVAAMAMMSRGGFGFLISASAFNAGLINDEIYASVVLAILFATIFPSYIMNFIIIRYESMKANAEKDEEAKLEAMGDGRMPLYLLINIETKRNAWGLRNKLKEEVSSIGLKIEDSKFSHTQGIDPTTQNKFYVRDDSTRVRICFKVPSIDEMGDEGLIVEDRFLEIQALLAEKLAAFEPNIEIYPWSPFDSLAMEALLSLFTRANGKVPSFEFFSNLFSFIDADGDGILSEEELKAGLQSSNFNIGDNGLNNVMKNMDTDYDGFISLGDWQQTISHVQKKQRGTLMVSSVTGRNNRASNISRREGLAPIASEDDSKGIDEASEEDSKGSDEWEPNV